jgi:hypothetical protein
MHKLLITIFTTLICVVASTAQAEDSDKLDKLLQKNDYKQFLKEAAEGGDAKTIEALRGRFRDWNFSANMQFYAFRFLPTVLKSEGRRPSLSAEEFLEVSAVWVRAKTILYVDRADCKANTPFVQNWRQGFNFISGPMQSIMGDYPGPLAMAGKDAVNWAKAKEFEGLRPAAVWVCGEDNVRPDAERAAARKNAIAELEAQLQEVARAAKDWKPAQ